MTCCNSKVFSPLINDPCGNHATLPAGATLGVPRLGNVQLINGILPREQLAQNTTYYVETWGSDTTGDGSTSSPYKTVHGALDRLAWINPGNFNITVQLGKGIFIHDSTIRPRLAWGGAVIFNGKRTFVSTSVTISNIDTAYSTDGSFPNLQYFDCDVDLSGDSPEEVEAGQFLQIRTVSGGTKNTAMRGLHKIITWDPVTEVASIRVWHKVDAAGLPSGSITVTAGNVLHSVLTWEDAVDDHGIEVIGFNAGVWTNIVIDGNQNQFDTRRGLRIWNGGAMAPNTRFGIHNFDVGAEIFAGATLEYPAGIMSKILTIGIGCSNGGATRFNFESYMNGCGQQAVRCQQFSTVNIADSIFVACSATRCVACETGAYVSAENALFAYEDKSPVTAACLDSFTLGNISATGATYTDFTTERRESTQGRTEPVP